MNYIVLDLEFNQAFDFKSGTSSKLNPECPFEIIQIGAVKLDNELKINDSFNFLIKPKIYKRIHPFVEKITGLTNSALKNCDPFPVAFQEFIEFIGRGDTVLCTWGNDDVKFLFRNILYYGLDISAITDKFINIQTFATAYLKYDPGKTIGLKNAINLLGLPDDAEFHNALNDAMYTAKIFQIVRPPVMPMDRFVTGDLVSKKQHSSKINTVSLTKYFSNSLNRELTLEEIAIIKTAYKLGRNNAYDIIPKSGKHGGN